MIKLDPSHRLLITGAGGWLGTELLELLLKNYGSEILQKSVICLGSFERDLVLSDGTLLSVYNLFDFEKFDSKNITGIVHLAFQTRDKVSSLGLEKYTFTNLSITSQILYMLHEIKPKWIATVSSGAILNEKTGQLETNLPENPYGFTKNVEETMLTSLSKELEINLSIGRLWGAMGGNMPVNEAYAVSDFIVQAYKFSEIKIRSGNEVWRRYCDAQEFMNILISSAETYPSTLFDSGGTLIELGQLASKISEMIPGNITVKRQDDLGIKNLYFPNSQRFEELARELNISLQDFEKLIHSTITNHIEQLEAT